MKSLPVLSFIVLLISCASTAHYSRADSFLARGDIASAYSSIEDSKGSYRKIDSVLYHLDSGLLAHYAGDFAASSARLEEGERAIERAFTKSVTMEIGTYLLNDMTQEYAGEDYEDIYLNVFNALNYYHRGSLEDALVEIRRIGNKLEFLQSKYGSLATNLQKSALEKSPGIPYDPDTRTVRFSNSALARYLGLLFYRGEGKYDDARIDSDMVKLAFANQPGLYPFPLPASLDGELNVPEDKARLNVISFCGLSPVKTAEDLRIPVSMSNWVKISLPVMQSRPSRVRRADVVMDSGERFELELIENIDAVARETFRQRSDLIYLKTCIRALSKTAASVTLSRAGRENDSGGLALAGILAQIFTEVSEQADLRISRYFPERALVGGISLEPGVYSYRVNFYDAKNAVIHQERFENAELVSGKLNLTEVICLK